MPPPQRGLFQWLEHSVTRVRIQGRGVYLGQMAKGREEKWVVSKEGQSAGVRLWRMERQRWEGEDEALEGPGREAARLG